MTQQRGASLKAWHGDWERRLTERLRERGFASATEYVATQPTASLVTMGHALGSDPTAPLYQGDGFAAVQLERRLLDEAKARGDVERCARDLLVRRLHAKLPEGWRTEWGPDIVGDMTTPFARRIDAIANWESGIALRLPEYRSTVDRMGYALRDATFPEGWLPSGPDDSLLVDVFRAHWSPSDSRTMEDKSL